MKELDFEAARQSYLKKKSDRVKVVGLERKKLIEYKKYYKEQILEIEKKLRTTRKKPTPILDEYEQSLIENIIIYCEEKYKLPVGSIKSPLRKHEVVLARQTIQYWLKYKSKSLKNNSFQNIGAVTGGRDHSTVIHAIGTIEDYLTVSASHSRIIKDMFLHFTNVIEKKILFEIGQKEWDKNRQESLKALEQFNDYSNASF